MNRHVAATLIALAVGTAASTTDRDGNQPPPGAAPDTLVHGWPTRSTGTHQPRCDSTSTAPAAPVLGAYQEHPYCPPRVRPPGTGRVREVPCGTTDALTGALRHAHIRGPGRVALPGADHLMHDVDHPDMLAPPVCDALHRFTRH